MGRSNVTIKHVNIKAFGDGIWLRYSSGCCVSGNIITNNYYGIRFDSSSNNSISGNNITANNGTGIYLDSSSGNTLSGNTIANNNAGIARALIAAFFTTIFSARAL